MDWIHTVPIDGRFYSTFSMLFGIGFGLFLDKGADGLLCSYRRMFFLLLVGWILNLPNLSASGPCIHRPLRRATSIVRSQGAPALSVWPDTHSNAAMVPSSAAPRPQRQNNMIGVP